MVIERSGFLLMAGTLAAGGVGGWMAHESKVRPVPSTVIVAPPTPPSAVPVIVVQHIPPPPVCDDSAGSPGDCPAVGPSDEGVCSNIAAKRCAEFKIAFKPKVAQAAVSCLHALKGNELCDPARVNLCGHTALMAACPDQPPSSAAVDAGMAASSPVMLACENITKSSSSLPLAPTTADCRQTLSGMTDAGRASMVECMATHAADKGLLGCEALKKI